MCGIFGIVSKKKRPINQEILAGLKTLEYRGYDSWGVAIATENGFEVVKKPGKIGETVFEQPHLAQLGIGHTRWATHGGVTKENAHPHLSYDGRFAIVHNGIIENYLELKSQLLAKMPTLEFKSETDSEVFAHLLAKKAETMPVKTAFFSTLKAIKGLNAVVVIDRQTKNLLAYRHGSPLVYGENETALFLASDAVALLPHTKLVYFLRDGEAIVDGKLFNLETGKTKKIKLEKLNLEVEQLNKGGFEFYMEKEIHEAPEVIGRLLSTYDQQAEPLLAIMSQFQEFALIGCGTAFYASLMGQYLLASVGRVAHAYSGGEVGHFLATLPKTVLPIFLSQSGETIDLIEQVNWLKKKNRPLVALVNRVSSTLDREATVSFHLQAGPEISVVSTKAFLAKLTALLLITGSLSNQLATTRRQLAKAQVAIGELLSSRAADLTRLARVLAKEERVFVLGRGQNYPIALEAALKAKEAAYLHFEGFAGGELKHGVIALIEPGTWTIVLMANDQEDVNMLSNAQEIKARGGKILGIGPVKHPVFDEWLPYPDLGRANILLETTLIQVLGLYLAKAKGLDPDKPRNLAKSVTVK